MTTHWLEHPTRDKAFTFRPTAAGVVVRRKVGSRWVEQRTVSVEEARRRWAWLVKLGWVKW